MGGIDIFGGSSETEEVELPEGCAWASDNRCLRCLSTYELDGSKCRKKEEEIPCNGEIPCNDAELVVKTSNGNDIPPASPPPIPDEKNTNQEETIFPNDFVFFSDDAPSENEGVEEVEDER